MLDAGRSVTVAGSERTIERSSDHGRFVRIKLTGIEQREEAQQLRGTYLQIGTADVPPAAEGEYYRFQLLGLAVHSADGGELGIVIDILSTVENDVYVVRGPLGEVLIPAVDDVVQQVDIAARKITIDVVPGLLP